jgi:hypothetical protein
MSFNFLREIYALLLFVIIVVMEVPRLFEEWFEDEQ